MELEGGGGDCGSDRAFDGLCDGSGFGCARGEQENFPRLQDRADAHSYGAARTFLTGGEEFRVVVQRFLAQDFQARAGGEAGSGLVEANVAVAGGRIDMCEEVFVHEMMKAPGMSRGKS